MTTLVQEREDVMVSSSPPTPILRLAHFLTVPDDSIDGSAIQPHPDQVSIHGSALHSQIQLNFCRWNNPVREWKEWVDSMYSKHQILWKKSGILDAVLNSKYKIYRNEELLHAFASKWCSVTNTFVFPWGEATLTLEDMMILGGYSVLGKPTFSPLVDSDTLKVKEIERKLEYERLELCKTKAKKACYSAWLGKFMNSGNEIEHEAFLVYWLSRFVFPIAADSIMKCLIPIAIHLANGERIALAPAVLASIYSDLNTYKKALLSSDKKVSVSSPFKLIQIWVWERFPLLQPKPNNVEPEEPSFAKWHGLNLKRSGDGIATNVMDKGVDSFIWCPYTKICGSLSPSRIEEGKQLCLPVTSGTDEEVEAMIKCLRVSELVGIDSKCIEQYLPHRVARQFRLDQDIPTLVKRANSDQKLAWDNYSRPVANRIFCIPSHHYEPNVTDRYLEWWKKPMSAQDNELETLEDGITLQESKKRKLMDSASKMPDNDPAGNALKDCAALKDGMTLQKPRKRNLKDAARKKRDNVPAGNALKDCVSLEDGIELKEGLLRESAGQEPADEASRDKVSVDNPESSKKANIGGSENNASQSDNDPAGNALKDCEALEDGMTLQKSKKRNLKDAARKKPYNVPAGNALKDCVSLEDGIELKEGLLRESARQEPADEASRDKVLRENLESSKKSNTGGSENNASQSASKKQDVDLLVPPGYCPSMCNKGGGICMCAKNVEKESLCSQLTHPNVQIASEEVPSRTLNDAEENDSLSKLEARILKVDETLALTDVN